MNRSASEHEPTDAELVCQAQRGRSAAFGELVARYQDRVFNVCYRMCHNHADALDLTQSAFLKALEALPRFESRANFYTWLFRIAVNLAISRRRDATRRGAAPLDEAAHCNGRLPDGLERRPERVDEELERQELHARVVWALQQLDEEFRAAVILKDIEELDYAAIAEVLEVPIGTVKSRIHRGRLMLRDLLRDERVRV
ncbi:MAG: sigma-70 family RNA polymerase sigma factor [Planctomycetota bacterium]